MAIINVNPGYSRKKHNTVKVVYVVEWFQSKLISIFMDETESEDVQEQHT